MKRVFVPHLNRHVVLGAVRARLDPHSPVLKIADYLDKGTLPPSPTSCDWSPPAISVVEDIEGNGEYGDCVLAEEAHFIALVTGNAGTLYSYTAAQTLAAYSAITGFNPNVPSSDQGTDPIAALNYFMANAYADGSKLSGYLLVDATNQQEVEFALSAFGNLKMWLSLPDPYVNPFPSANGFVWDVGTPDPSNGHCIGGCGYNKIQVLGTTPQGITIMTWGMIGTMTWAAVSQLCVASAGGGLAVRVTPDWLNKATQKTPSGFAWSDLISDFDAMGGTLPVPPAPTPVPPPNPNPAPTATVTMEQVQGWATSGLQNANPLLVRDQALTLVQSGIASNWPQAAP